LKYMARNRGGRERIFLLLSLMLMHLILTSCAPLDSEAHFPGDVVIDGKVIKDSVHFSYRGSVLGVSLQSTIEAANGRVQLLEQDEHQNPRCWLVSLAGKRVLIGDPSTRCEEAVDARLTPSVMGTISSLGWVLSEKDMVDLLAVAYPDVQVTRTFDKKDPRKRRLIITLHRPPGP
jgi:hypothetical protein